MYNELDWLFIIVIDLRSNISLKKAEMQAESCKTMDLNHHSKYPLTDECKIRLTAYLKTTKNDILFTKNETKTLIGISRIIQRKSFNIQTF